MKTKYSHKQMAAAGLATTFLLFSSLALPTALAKKPGSGGGGGGGGGGAGPATLPVPDLAVTAPVAYEPMELVWDGPETDHYVFLNCINKQGFAVGILSLGDGGDDLGQWFWQGAVNAWFDPDSGELTATNTMANLNDLFAVSLEAFNAKRATDVGDGPWRIDQAHWINQSGQIGCRLIPADQPRWRDSVGAAEVGTDPVPCLLAVADLRRLPELDPPAADALLIMDPNDTDPDKYLMMVTEAGDLFAYMTAVTGPDGPGIPADFALYYRDGASYSPMAPPADVASWPANVNSELQVVSQTLSSSGTYRLNRYTLDPISVLPATPVWNPAEVLWESNEIELHGEAIAEDGSVYAEARISRKVRGRQITSVIPYHITDEGRRPLVDIDKDESAGFGFRYLSRAGESGEEELIMAMRDGTYQIYKPNAGLRFELPLDPFAASYIGVSPPVMAEGAYQAGYVAYSTRYNDPLPRPRRSYILVPVPNQP